MRSLSFLPFTARLQLTSLYSQWSIADDWDSLSNAAADPWKERPFADVDAVPVVEDTMLRNSLDTINSASYEMNDVAFVEEMEDALPLLIRCNQLLEEDTVKDVSLLYNATTHQATEWFTEGLLTMFQRHTDIDHWDATSVASWMSTALKEERVGPHDGRVHFVLSKYGTQGQLDFSSFEKLYLDTIRQGRVNDVWRDLEQHGILLESKTPQVLLDTIYDECSLFDDTPIHWTEQGDDNWVQTGKSSHMLVEMASQNTPLYLKDGDFVFIDEESCIGCTQCVQADPSSFQMLEDGRARCYNQHKMEQVAPAIASCPVNCMHRVGFDRLKELEELRDNGGDLGDDHRHFGERDGQTLGRTPLWVAGIDTDANHKSSIYHYTVNKCYKSGNCPQKGCFDCPLFAPEKNKYLKERQGKDLQVRAEYLKRSGIANEHRKVSEL